MKPSTLAYLLGPMGILARPHKCGGHKPSSTTVASVTATASVTSPGSPGSGSPSSAAPTSVSVTSPGAPEGTTTSTGVPEVTTSTAASSSTSASSTTTSSSTAPTSTPTGSGLDARFKAKGKQYFGTSADAGTLGSAQNAAVVNAEFGQLTPENSMKWDAIEPTSGGFSFAGADALVDFAERNGQLVRGHTLLWYQQLPDYVEAITDRAELTAVIESHIAGVVGRYKGRVHAWDVVNEIFTEEGTFRDDVFSRVLGEDYVRIAFEAARAADPSAKLYINDFHLESGTSAKVTVGMVPHVKEWLAAGVPIDGIGVQGHLGGGNPDAAGMLAGLEALAATGVAELAITELDIVDAPADEYVKVTEACLAVEACVGITTWGVSDKDSWLTEKSPLLFDANFEPKPAYDAIMEVLS